MIIKWFGYSIDEQVRKLYLLVVLLIVLYMIIALLFGLPVVHIIRGEPPHAQPRLADTPSIIAPERP